MLPTEEESDTGRGRFREGGVDSVWDTLSLKYYRLSKWSSPAGIWKQSSKIQGNGVPCGTQVRLIRINCFSYPLPIVH